MAGKEFVEWDWFEGGDADDLEDMVEAVGQLAFLFGDGDQQICADGSPDLTADGIGRASEEMSQAKVLFDPAEEQFDLPSAAVE